jgi:hypothetical protein
MLSLLATFALGAVVSATASANASHEWFINGAKITGTETVSIAGNQIPGNNQLEGVVASTSVHIVCQEVLTASGANYLEKEGKLKMKLEYKACTVYSIAGGVIENQPKCRVLNMTAEGSGELIEAGQFKLEGKPFVIVRIENAEGVTCLIKGEYKVEPSLTCSLPHYAVQGYVAVIECNPEGSKELKLGTEIAKLFTSFGVAGTKGQLLSSN